MGRVALVTGGTRGIGRAISLALQADGHTVVASYGGNDEAALAFKDKTGIAVYKFDVGDFDACTTTMAQITSDVGAIEILVNNAGITRDKPLHKMDRENWDAVINTNLSGLFNTCRNVIDSMREQGFGRIINISSINGQKGQFGQTNYSPGYIGTEMVMAVPEKILNEVIIPQIPVGRLGQPEEIARCVTFLASDDAGFITGSTLTANGGQYLI